MPNFFHVDHRVVALGTIGAAFSIAAFSTYKYWSLKRKQKNENVYETVKSLHEYLVFHYGSPTEVMAWNVGPRCDIDFPRRCADLCIQHFKKNPVIQSRALDIGCAVGRSTFELTRVFDEAVGIDWSKSFIDTCNLLKDKGQLGYSVITQGRLESHLNATIDPTIERRKARFQRGDACNLPLDIGQFSCVLAANLIDRLVTPQAFLDRLPNLIVSGGILVITTPYTFLEEFTPRENWLGGFVMKDGREYTGFDGLKDRLEPFFVLEAEENLPFVIRETERKHQWTVAHATIWRRK